MRHVSLAVAKNTLSELVHQVERAPVEITRRGKPVAVLVSHEEFERLRGAGDKPDLLATLDRLRERGAFDDLGDWVGPRDWSPTGGRKGTPFE